MSDTVVVMNTGRRFGGSMAEKIKDATNRGHVMVDTGKDELLPGAFAVCHNCRAYLRLVNGEYMGEAKYTYCPTKKPLEALTVSPSNTDSVETQRDWEQEYGERTVNDWSDIIHGWALDKGWWIVDPDINVQPSFDSKLVLVHSELSEALEEWRDNHPENMIYYKPDKNGIPKPEGIPIELADAIIRICDMAGYWNIDLQQAMLIKMAYNEKRPYRHGGKRS